MKEVRDAIDLGIKKEGLIMSKKLQSAYYGFFTRSDAVYDKRTVYSYEEACKLAGEGFYINNPGEVGVLLLNALMK